MARRRGYRRKSKVCSRTAYRRWFKVYIKKHAFKTAVRMAWARACRRVGK